MDGEEIQEEIKTPFLNKKKIILAILLMIFGAAAAGCYIYRSKIFNRSKVITAAETKTEFFAKPTPVQVTPAYQEGNPELGKIPNYKAIKTKYGLKLNAAQENYLQKNKFLLVDINDTSYGKPGDFGFDEMLRYFDSIGTSSIFDRKPEETVLVTPDIVLHAYHKYFELTLKQLEQNELGTYLGNFLTSLQENLATATNNSSGTVLERYQNLQAQILLARVLWENKSAAKPAFFENPDDQDKYLEADKTVDSYENGLKILNKYTGNLPKDLTAEIQMDLKSIYDTSGQASQLFGQYSDELKTDFTQYTPRSHYTENSTLRAYFRTMMYLGRSSYFLKKDVGILDTSLLVKQMGIKSSSGIVPSDPWNKIMKITGFYAGVSDDLTYTEWKGFVDQVIADSSLTDEKLASSESLQKLATNLNKIRLPKILSDIVVYGNIDSLTKADLLRDSLSFRIFGQRFSFDGWILNDLTAGLEKTTTKLPSTPTALFVPATLGDEAALAFAKDFLKNDRKFTADKISGWEGKLKEKRADLNKVTKEEWRGSLGSAWLYVLQSLTHSYDQNYPLYMQSMPFAAKQIQTFLGSYTELKHDTLLYAKQSYAELGGGPDENPIPPVVKGFVEPNMDFWNRFNELISQTGNVFSENKLFSDSVVMARLKDFSNISGFYTEIARKELASQVISEEEYEKLRTTKLGFMAQPLDGLSDPGEDVGKTALIADVHTDAVDQKILYEATDRPYLMLTVVDNESSPRVTAGFVYNHYEFKTDLGKRLSDQDWRKWVYNNRTSIPEKNFWYEALIVK